MVLCLFGIYITLIFVILIGELTIITSGLWSDANMFVIVISFALVMFVVVLAFPILLSLFTGVAC
jgi:hypothetical protein